MNAPSNASTPRRASMFGSRSTLRLACLALAAVALGACDAERAPASGWGPAGEGWVEDALGEGGGGGEAGTNPSTPGSDVLVGPCDGAIERACKAPAPNCVVGFQACVDGMWSHCQRDFRENRSDGAGGAGGAR